MIGLKPGTLPGFFHLALFLFYSYYSCKWIELVVFQTHHAIPLLQMYNSHYTYLYKKTVNSYNNKLNFLHRALISGSRFALNFIDLSCFIDLSKNSIALASSPTLVFATANK